MVNWQDPQILFLSGRAAATAIHCAFGAYAWEWLSTLSHDLDFVLGKRRFNVGAVLYLLCRYFALTALTLAVRTVNAMTPDVDCDAWLTATLFFAFSAAALTSGLLYIRVVALSKENRWIIGILGLGYLAVWALVGVAVAKTETFYFAPLFVCTPVRLKRYAVNMTVPFAYDTICLGLMLFYLLKMRTNGGHLWKYLVQQGIMYALGVCLAYLFAIVIISLDLNDSMSDIGLVVILTMATLCATRMQRGLAEFFEKPQHLRSMSHGANLSGGAITPSATKPHPSRVASHNLSSFSQSHSGHGQLTSFGTPHALSVHVDVDVVDVRDDGTDWKDRELVKDDYELGKVSSPRQPQYIPQQQYSTHPWAQQQHARR